MQVQANLLKEQRHEVLLGILQHEGKLVASDLSARLNVSEDTIRRDLREMAREQKLQRVHGGALPRALHTPPYSERTQYAVEAKSAIGATAAALAQDGQLIFLDGGTTTLQLARHLAPDLRATIVTNSPPIAVTLSEHRFIEVVMLGGKLDKQAQVTVGAATVAELRTLRADLCFLGVCSLHPEIGIAIPSLEEGYVKRAMIECSVEVVGLVTADKLGTAYPYLVGPANVLTYLVTDSAAGEEKLAAYREMGTTVIRAR
jgi:DeoR/GlpR family transcriptional regulator of sugar metabolism